MLDSMDDLQGKFVVKRDGELIEVDRCGDLPDEFDHLIRFEPKIPEPPHSVNDHIAMSKWSEYLHELVSKESK
tara:strand:- start:3058 stop:3276 length:219 start_codon:yes stop_codon:yes gene_type:complete